MSKGLAQVKEIQEAIEDARGWQPGYVLAQYEANLKIAFCRAILDGSSPEELQEAGLDPEKLLAYRQELKTLGLLHS